MHIEKKQMPLVPVISPPIPNLIAAYIHDRRATGMTELAIRKVFAILASFAKHCGHRRFPYVGAFGEIQQRIKPGIWREVDDAFGVVSGRVVHTGSPAARATGFFERGTSDIEADFGKVQKDQPEHRQGVLLRGQAAIRAELVGCAPEVFFQRIVGNAFFPMVRSNALCFQSRS